MVASESKKIICGHDLDWPGVKRAVKEIFDDEFETNDGGDYLDKTNKLD